MPECGLIDFLCNQTIELQNNIGVIFYSLLSSFNTPIILNTYKTVWFVTTSNTM